MACILGDNSNAILNAVSPSSAITLADERAIAQNTIKKHAHVSVSFSKLASIIFFRGRCFFFFPPISRSRTLLMVKDSA